jgi:hypothetical protein
MANAHIEMLLAEILYLIQRALHYQNEVEDAGEAMNEISSFGLLDTSMTELL